MTIHSRLQSELEQRKVPFEVLEHREVFTAPEVAQSSHVPGRLLAKPVVVREREGHYYMVVVAAHQHADLDAIQALTGRASGRLANEQELARLFPDCELGAMPPVGRLYGMDTYLDENFRNHRDIYFQAGNHHEVVKMKFADFAKVAGPFTGEFMVHRETTGFRH